MMYYYKSFTDYFLFYFFLTYRIAINQYGIAQIIYFLYLLQKIIRQGKIYNWSFQN